MEQKIISTFFVTTKFVKNFVKVSDFPSQYLWRNSEQSVL